MIQHWIDRRKERDIKRISHWFRTGIVDYKRGVPATQGPWRYGTRQHRWWLHGWTSQWVDENDKA